MRLSLPTGYKQDCLKKMDEFQLLEDYFNHMVGKKIIGVGVIDDELVFKLDDGSQVTIFSDLDNDLSMNLVYTN